MRTVRNPEQRRWHVVLVQIALPAALTVLLFALTVFFVILPGLEEQLTQAKRATVQELVLTARSLIEECEGRAASGELTLEEAQEQATDQIRALRYGPENKDYFWVCDLHPRMVVHPYRRDLEGEDLSAFADSTGKRLFVDAVDLARRQGGGYVPYLWQWKDDPERVVPKESYVLLFEPWGWIVGTGIYRDDVRAEIAEITGRIARTGLAILALVVLFSGYIVRQAVRVEGQRSKAEKAVRASEERLRTIVHSASEIVYTLSPEGVFSYVSPAWTRLLGHEVHEVEGRSFTRFVNPDDVGICREFLKKVYETGAPQQGVEYRVKHRNGEWRWHASTGALARDSAGTPLYYVGVSQDITERKLAEETLRHRLAMEEALARVSRMFVSGEPGLEKVVRAVGEAAAADRACIVLWEPETTAPTAIYEWTKPGLETVAESLQGVEPSAFGWWRKQLAEDGVIVVRDPEDWPRDAEEERGLALSRGVLSLMAVPVKSRDGNVAGFMGFDTCERAREWSGEDIRLLRVSSEMVARHLDRVRSREEAEIRNQQLIQTDKMVSLGILVSGVAHEVNNPNGYIRLGLPMVEAAFRQALSILEPYYEENGDFVLGSMSFTEARAEIPEMLSEMMEGTERIARVVNELRDFALHRPDARTEPLDVNTVVKSAVTLAANLIRKSTQHFEIRYGVGLPEVQGNFQRLEQVVVNLLVNACQALSEASQGVFVSTEYNGESDAALIVVCDGGCGVRPEDVPHVTDPFFTTRRERGGTGLGLSVSSRIVGEHGGTLTLESTLGEGTTVTVSLPVRSKNKDEDE